MLSIGDCSSYVGAQPITGESRPQCSHLITLGISFGMPDSLPHRAMVGHCRFGTEVRDLPKLSAADPSCN